MPPSEPAESPAAAWPFPRLSRGERIADGCIHGLGLAATVVCVPVLMVVAVGHGGDALTLFSLGLYAIGFCAMLWSSALYHLARDPVRKEFLRRVDHAAIFVMIAGTYSPFVLVKVGGAWGLGLFIFVWVVAAIGVVLKLRFPRRWEALAIAAYLGLGWVAVVAFEPIVAAVPTPVLVLLATGGVIYSVGVLFYISRWLPYRTAIWHGFVLAAAGVHYAAVMTAVAADGVA